MTAPLRRLLREPLLHFAVAGVALFAAFAAVRGPVAPGDTTIVVDRRALLAYLQVKANTFDTASVSSALDALSEREVAELVDQYVAEEVLYREAQVLGLERGDSVVRQRMIQKMKLALGDLAVPDAEPDVKALADYFAAHEQEYALPPVVTFTHVFFDAERRRGGAARADAERAVRELNAAHAEFNDAPGHGDRFPFAQNYVNRTLDDVASQFGSQFAAALGELDLSGTWQGPVRSAYGEHAVLLTRRTELRHPELEEVRERVEADYLREHEAAELAKLTRAVRERYRVEVVDVRAEPAP